MKSKNEIVIQEAEGLQNEVVCKEYLLTMQQSANLVKTQLNTTLLPFANTLNTVERIKLYS